MKLVYEVFAEYNKARTKEDRISILKKNDSWALKDIIRGILDEKIEWNIPDGTPPYTPAPPHSTPSNLLKQNVKFKHFVKGGTGDKLPGVKREKIYLELLESVHPEDAKLVIAMISKEKPVRQLTKPIVHEAFPGLIPGFPVDD